MRKIIFLTLFTVFCSVSFANELILKQVKVGNVEQLAVGDKKIAAIYTVAKDEKGEKAVLLIPDARGNVNWPEVIRPLRIKMADKGFSTLSLQMQTEDPKQAAANIDAGIDFLKKNGNKNIFIIGHGTGASMLLTYASSTEKLKPEIKGVVLLSTIVPTFLKPEQLILDEKKWETPLLDIIAPHDYLNVNTAAKKRQRLYQKQKWYHQREVIGADHFYSNMTEQLIRKIRGWEKKIMKKKAA